MYHMCTCIIICTCNIILHVQLYICTLYMTCMFLLCCIWWKIYQASMPCVSHVHLYMYPIWYVIESIHVYTIVPDGYCYMCTFVHELHVIVSSYLLSLESLDVWGKLACHKRSLIHRPSSQGWAPCVLLFCFMGWGFLGFLSPPFCLFASVLYTYNSMYRRDCEQLAKFTAFKESAKCVSLGPENLPSVCCYTLLNTYQEYVAMHMHVHCNRQFKCATYMYDKH